MANPLGIVSSFIHHEKKWQFIDRGTFLETEKGKIVAFNADEHLTMSTLSDKFIELNTNKLTLAIVDSDSSIAFYTVTK